MTFFQKLSYIAIILQCACITVEMKEQKDSARQSTSKESNPSDSLSRTPPSTQKIDEMIDKANQYARDGLYREAMQNYNVALSIDAKNPEANRNIGMVYVKTGQYDNAVKHLKNAADAYPKNFETNYYLAEALRAQNNYSEAIFRYKMALAANPQHIQTLKALSWSYFQTRFYKAAYNTARRLKSLVKRDTQVDIIIARILDKMGRSRVAMRTLRKSLINAQKSEKPYIQSALGEIIANSGNCRSAIVIFQEALKAQPLLAGALVGLGKCFIETEHRIELARSYLERAIRLKPRMIEAYYYLGKSYEKTDLTKAKRYYARFYRQAAGDPAFIQKIENSKSRIQMMSRNKNEIPKINGWPDPM